MKKTFTLCLALLCSLCMNAEINYTNYGDGWIIPMNAAQALDIDGDGNIDLYANQYQDEMGLSPVFAVGCISTPSAGATVSFGAYELAIFEEGDNIQATQGNLFDYIDDGRGSAYQRAQGFANGFEAEEEYYLGFILMKEAYVQNGWMKVQFNEVNETMTIMEIAYGDLVIPGEEGIIAGDTGLSVVSINDLSEDLTGLTVSPNPAQDYFNINFDYNASQALRVDIYNSVGQLVKEVSVANAAGNYNLNVNSSDWNSGIFYVRLQSSTGVKSTMIFIK